MDDAEKIIPKAKAEHLFEGMLVGTVSHEVRHRAQKELQLTLFSPATKEKIKSPFYRTLIEKMERETSALKIKKEFPRGISKSRKDLEIDADFINEVINFEWSSEHRRDFKWLTEIIKSEPVNFNTLCS